MQARKLIATAQGIGFEGTECRSLPKAITTSAATQANATAGSVNARQRSAGGRCRTSDTTAAAASSSRNSACKVSGPSGHRSANPVASAAATAQAISQALLAGARSSP